jgi:glutathione S-transferase
MERMDTNLVLYMYPGACSRVTMTALEEIGLTYEARPVNLQAGGQKSPEYTAVNRKGKVPALLVDGRLLTENAAILAWLDHSHPEAALITQTGHGLEHARGLSDVIWCASTLHPMVRQIRNPQRFTLGETAGVKADGQQKFAVECAHMNERLSGSPWWNGQTWSIVDTYLYWACSAAAKGDFPLGDYPAIVEHAQRVRWRPAFQRALAKEIEANATAELGLDPTSL